MSSSELSGDRRFVKGGSLGIVNELGPEPENIECPRCSSNNTKFCYYNNYNLSQPRYFCKACRRYWTRGGSLRNIPVGGGSRKNSRRSRPITSPHPPPPASLPPAASFTSQSPFLGLGGYGLGSGLEGLAFGNDDDGSSTQLHDQETVSECNTWQLGETDGGDCFGWPELAMSTPGTAVLERSFWPAN